MLQRMAKTTSTNKRSALMAGCGLAPAALSDALAPLADSARVETDQSDQQIEGPSSVAANTPASLADSDSAAGNVPALCAGQQDMCLTSGSANWCRLEFGRRATVSPMLDH